MRVTDEMVEAAARAIAATWGLDWACVCSDEKGLDCDCGDAMSENRNGGPYDERLTREECRLAARAALEAALAVAGTEVEPVAWRHRGPKGGWITTEEKQPWSEEPLYTTPPAGIREALEEQYVVWSHEHSAWWRPNRAGYAQRLEDAGVYSRDDALCISHKGRDGWLPDEAPDELPIRLTDLPDWALAALRGQS